MADILLDDVSRVQSDGTVAVSHLTLHAREGELLAVVGPSGCGKSTTLRMIAGVEPVTHGTIAIGGRDVTRLPPAERDVAMVFEGRALYPHLSALRNLRFGLEVRKTPEREIADRVGAEARVLGLGRLLHRRPATLSAGQQQRVALARATVRLPKAFLLDEPLGHLDGRERVRMRAELGRLQHGLGVTTLYVTHDQTEAMAVGDRVAVLREGTLEQLGTPRAVYQEPASAFVASFFGTPPMRLVAGSLQADPDGAAWIVLGDQRLAFAGTPSGPLRRFLGRGLVVGFRPEHLDLAGGPAPGGPHRRLRALVVGVEHLGPELLLSCQLDAQAVEVPDTAGAPRPGPGPATLVVRAPRPAPARPGAAVEVAVDTRRLSFFDPATGAALWHGA